MKMSIHGIKVEKYDINCTELGFCREKERVPGREICVLSLNPREFLSFFYDSARRIGI